MIRRVGVLQLPHHASHNNSDEHLDLGGTFLPFATCKEGDEKHPHRKVVAFVQKKGLDVHPVTEDPNSLLRTVTLLAL